MLDSMVWKVTTEKTYIAPTGGRLIVGWTSFVGGIICTIILVYGSLTSKLDFVPTLIAAFIFALCLTHGRYAFAQNLTQKQVRKIDYWYLGSAAIGMFMFAVGYSEQRETAITRSRDFVYRQGEDIFMTNVMKAVSPYMNATCKDDIRKLSEKPCDTSLAIAEGMKPGATPELVEHYMRRLANAKIDLAKNGDNPALDKLSTEVGVNLVMLKDYIVANTPKHQFIPHDEGMLVMFSMGQMVFWPFLLAFALALRIAKVTIDVFGWADN
ncbi:K+-transporting ATPase c subunit [Bradyrhizobium sp. USDA 4341]